MYFARQFFAVCASGNKIYQEGLLKEWAEKYKLNVEIVPLNDTEDESVDKINSGEIDGYATIFSFDYNHDVIPVTRIGGSDYYYAVSLSRPDLLEDLNMAMAEIQDEDPYFNEKLSKERLFNKSNTALLTSQQEEWLAEHGEIRIGYRRDYFPFCGTDDETGEVTGALKDYLAHALNNLNSENLKFKLVPYDDTEAVLNGLSSGEIDCAFPISLSTYDAEQRGIMLTDPAMETEMNAIMRISDRFELSDDTDITFAVNANMVNVETFIKRYYPKSRIKPFNGLSACYDAVENGDADCVLVSNYRIAPSEEIFKEKDLYSVPTGEAMSLSFQR